MTTKEEILRFLEIHQQNPVVSSPYASIQSRRRIRTDKMRLRQLPVSSIARYIENGAFKRASANEGFESEGFVSYRQLVPVMRRLFSDIWPSSTSSEDSKSLSKRDPGKGSPRQSV